MMLLQATQQTDELKDRLTSHMVFSNHRRVTRHQVSIIKQTFPFLELPAELRNLVYIYCIDLNSLEPFFDQHYRSLVEPQSRRRKWAAVKQTPAILLASKQVYREASFLFRNQSISFHHGLLKAPSIADVISPSLLRKVRAIEITDAGHPITSAHTLPTSWYGYMRIIEELGEILGQGHQLKTFTISFQDKKLEEHMTHCYKADYKCGFRDQMAVALNSLRKIRDVGEVTLFGLNIDEARSLKKRMESKPPSFFDLPCELRDMIYDYCLDWSECSQPLARALGSVTCKSCGRFPFPKLTTPTILLLNSRITAEAKLRLSKKPLVLTLPESDYIYEHDLIPSLFGFISSRTFKQVETIHMKLESWEWIFSVNFRLVSALVTSTKLQNFHFTFKDSLKKSFLAVGTPHYYPDRKVYDALKLLAHVRGLKNVTFDGDLPLVFTAPLAQIMTSSPSVPDGDLPKLMAINAQSAVVDPETSADT